MPLRHRKMDEFCCLLDLSRIGELGQGVVCCVGFAPCPVSTVPSLFPFAPHSFHLRHFQSIGWSEEG
jgi:hypothetical protein